MLESGIELSLDAYDLNIFMEEENNTSSIEHDQSEGSDG
jgi:hypothetical protein